MYALVLPWVRSPGPGLVPLVVVGRLPCKGGHECHQLTPLASACPFTGGELTCRILHRASMA